VVVIIIIIIIIIHFKLGTGIELKSCLK